MLDTTSCPWKVAKLMGAKKKLPESFTVNVPQKDCCGTCLWATTRRGSTFVVCEVDLPPMLAVSNAANRSLVNQNYYCALHQGRR